MCSNIKCWAETTVNSATSALNVLEIFIAPSLNLESKSLIVRKVKDIKMWYSLLVLSKELL